MQTGALTGETHPAAVSEPPAGDPLQSRYVTAGNPGEGDFFGYSVAAWGSTLVVGATDEDGSGADLAGSDDGAHNSGAAHVFSRHDDGFTQDAYLKAHNANAHDFFGWQVAIEQDVIVVGAPIEASNGYDGVPV